MPTLPFNISSLFPQQSLDQASGFPQQFMQEVLRLSTPVGQSPNDDTILAQALYDGKRNGKTYKQVLEGLHGVCHLQVVFLHLANLLSVG